MTEKVSRNFLAEAYEILFNIKPYGLLNREIAKELLKNFNGQVFVGDEKKEKIVCAALAYILLYVNFPEENLSEARRLYSRASGLLEELDGICSLGLGHNEEMLVPLLAKYKKVLAVY